MPLDGTDRTVRPAAGGRGANLAVLPSGRQQPGAAGDATDETRAGTDYLADVFRDPALLQDRKALSNRLPESNCHALCHASPPSFS